MTLVSAATRIGQWMKECQSEHNDACPRDADARKLTWTPTRLLRISRNKLGVRLIETKGSHFPYTALSYCWGQSPTSLTTRWNYHKRLLFLALARLPRLHQDAVELTRLLNIRYIWIDAFCIKQDNKEDWRKEAAMMADVYGNAAVVLSAAHAASVNESLMAEAQPTVIRNKFRSMNDRPSEILAWSSIPHKLSWSPPRGNHDWPTLMRGWTFQERLLASRCVHFGPRELLWECSSLKSCQCGRLDKYPSESIRHVLDELSRFSDPDPKEMVYAYAGTWMALVLQFSGRKLSRDEDRLVAIHGLSKKFESSGLGRYCAGLWENDVLQGLMWKRHTDAACYRPQKRIAPTWSWASVVGEVWYDLVNRNESFYHAKFMHLSRHSDATCGKMTLFAPTLEVDFDPGVAMPVRTDDVLLLSEWHLDIQLSSRAAELAKGQRVVCAFVFSFKSAYSKCAMALALSTTPSGLFHRVGLLTLSPWDNTMAGMDGLRAWIDTLPENTVVIE